MSLRSPLATLLTLFLMTMTPVVAMAQHMAMPTPTAPSGPTLGADAAFGPHGRLWVVTVHHDHVWLRHSDDLGSTFSTPVAVNAKAERISAKRENRPRIAVGARGDVYVSWSHPLNKQWASEVQFARSTDGGQTFSAPVVVNRGPAGVTHSFNTMAVAGNGDVVIAWLDGRAMAAAMAAGKPHRGLALYYAWSSDHGQTFTPGRRLMDHTCECCRIALARTPDGHIAAFFRGIFGDNIRDHVYGVLQTSRAPDHWQRATFSGWQIAACPEQGPGLAVGGNGVRHAVWYEASHGPIIWYGQLDPGHPPKHKVQIGGAGAGHADVAVHNQTVWVVWNQVSAAGYRLMARVSHDDGRHFGPAHVIARTTVAVYSPQLLVHAGHAYVAWNTAKVFRLIPVVEP